MKLKLLFENWITSWISLICDSINILTLGIYRPWWDFKYISYKTKKNLKKSLDK